MLFIGAAKGLCLPQVKEPTVPVWPRGRKFAQWNPDFGLAVCFAALGFKKKPNVNAFISECVVIAFPVLAFCSIKVEVAK